MIISNPGTHTYLCQKRIRRIWQQTSEYTPLASLFVVAITHQTSLRLHPNEHTLLAWGTFIGANQKQNPEDSSQQDWGRCWISSPDGARVSVPATVVAQLVCCHACHQACNHSFDYSLYTHKAQVATAPNKHCDTISSLSLWCCKHIFPGETLNWWTHQRPHLQQTSKDTHT